MQSLAATFQRLPLRAWLLLGVFLLLWKLDYAPFWNPDEGRYSSAALEMARPLASQEGIAGAGGSRGDWTVPHLNTIPRLNKPPLVYWLGATSYSLLGPSETSARLVSALAAIAVMLGLYFLGRSMFGEPAAVASALIWSTSLLAAGLGRVINTDMLLTASMFFVFGGVFLAGEEPVCRYSRIRPYLWSGIGMGLALLAKGPVGVALPLLIGGIYLTVAGRWRHVSLLGVLGAVVLALCIAAPWFIAMETRVPGFNRRFLLEENLGRFSGGQKFHDKTPLWFYLPIVLLGVMPWTGFWLAAASRTRQFVGSDGKSTTRRIHLFCWLWAVLLVGFFSLSSTKLISYILPAFPAFALLLGEAFGGEGEWKRGIRNAALTTATVLSLILTIAGGRYLTDDKTLPAAEGMPYAIAAGAILLLTSAALWLYREDRWKLFCIQAMGAVTFLVTLLSLAGHISRYEDASPMLIELKPYLRPEDRIVEYRTFQPSAIFYAARPITLVEFVNNSGLDESHPNFGKLFVKAEQLEVMRRSPRRVFALTRWNYGDDPEFSGWKLIGTNNDYRLFCNRDVPAGFSYDFTAPRKRNRVDKAPAELAPAVNE